MAQLRKITALILVVVMTLSLCGLGVLADDEAVQTEQPVVEATAEPAADPTEEPAADPTEEPAADPTEEPAADPTEEPAADPTEEPAADPTEEPAADPTEEPTEAPALTEQEISVTADDGAVITVAGLLPADATVTAVPVTVTLEDGVVLAAYDITIFDGDGAVWQPDERVTVSINTPVVAEEDEVTIYHMEDETAEPEEVATVPVEGTEVSFEAESFSIYVVSGNNKTPIDGAVALNTLTGLKVGDTLWVYSDLSGGWSGGWSVANESVVEIVYTSGRYAQIEAVSVGTATLTYTRGGQSDSITVAVTAADLTTVAAANASGVDITMYNLPNNNSGDYLVGTIGGSYKAATASTGLMSETLGTDGWPTYGGGSSLGALIATEAGSNVYSGVTGLLLDGGNGYLTYDSAMNFAALNTSTKAFTIYNALGTPEDKYAYGNFLPFNTIGDELSGAADSSGHVLYLPSEGSADFHFAMHLSADFAQPKDGKVADAPMTFDFTGDDDVWVYIDGVLVLDIGGIHGSLSGSINFADGTVTKPNGTTTNLKELFAAAGKDTTTGFKANTFADYTTHSIVMIYMERGAGASNLKIRFNLPTVPKSSVTVTKDFTLDSTSTSTAPAGFAASFELYNSSDEKVGEVAYNNTNFPSGSYTFTGLDAGTYTVKEVLSDVPTGYSYAGTTVSTGSPSASGTQASVAVSAASGATVTFDNKYTTTTTTVTATKTWNNAPAGTTATLAVYADGEEPVATATITAPASGYTFIGLPAYSGDTAISYTVKETEINGVTVPTTGRLEVKDSGNNALGYWTVTQTGNAITNTYTAYTYENSETKGSFTIKKVDGSGNPITSSAATFSLYTDSAATATPVATYLTSTTDGTVTVSGLAAEEDATSATYYLKETTAPTGYTASDTIWTISVTKGDVTVTGPSDANVFTRAWSWIVSVFTGENDSTGWDAATNTLTVTNAPVPTYGVTYRFVGDFPDGATVPVDSIAYYAGDPVTVAAALTTTATSKDGVPGTWSFLGWDKTDFNITANTIITGTWSFVAAQTYGVTYQFTGDFPGDATVPVDNTAYYAGDPVTVAAAPTTTATSKDGVPGTWSFLGWDKTDFNITANTIITGTWSFVAAQTYGVTYQFAGDFPGDATVPVDSIAYYAGDPVTVAAAPTTTATSKGGVPGTWSFLGWDKTDFNITANTIITGTWSFVAAPTYGVTYQFAGDSPGDATVPLDNTAYYAGDPVTVAAAPTTTATSKDGVPGTWSFLGWTTSDAEISNSVFTMPAKSVILTGTWSFVADGTYKVLYTDGAGNYYPDEAGTTYYTSQTYTVLGNDVTLFAKANHSFWGWSVSVTNAPSAMRLLSADAGKPTEIGVHGSGSSGETILYTAVWTANTYNLEVTKTVSGATLPNDFYIEVAGPDFTQTLRLTDEAEFENVDGVYHWYLSELTAGTYTATEYNYAVSGRVWSGTGTGSAVLSDATAAEGEDYAATIALTNTYTTPYTPPVTPTTHTLTVRWVDDAGNALATAVTKTFTSGSAYNAANYESGSARAFEGYTYTKLADGSDPASGTMNGNKTVTFVYAPVTDIPEESPPLNPNPGDDGGTVDIPDEEVPLDGTPKTGDSTSVALLWLVFCASASGLVVLAATAPKKKHEER